MKYKILYIALLFMMLSCVCKSQEITMFPGFWKAKYYEDDSQVTKQYIETLMLKDKEANQLWQKSKNHLTIGWVALGAEIGFLIWQLNSENQTVPLIGVLASAGVAIGFSISSSNLQKDAILKYNKNQDIGSLKFGPTYNGLGLVYSF